MSEFPMPFGGITSVVTLTTFEAGAVIDYILDEQDKGHFHNFAVEIDNPAGVRIWGSSQLIFECIKPMLEALRD